MPKTKGHSVEFKRLVIKEAVNKLDAVRVNSVKYFHPTKGEDKYVVKFFDDADKRKQITIRGHELWKAIE